LSGCSSSAPHGLRKNPEVPGPAMFTSTLAKVYHCSIVTSPNPDDGKPRAFPSRVKLSLL
jgi:hypothetical protein